MARNHPRSDPGAGSPDRNVRQKRRADRVRGRARQDHRGRDPPAEVGQVVARACRADRAHRRAPARGRDPQGAARSSQRDRGEGVGVGLKPDLQESESLRLSVPAGVPEKSLPLRSQGPQLLVRFLGVAHWAGSLGGSKKKAGDFAIARPVRGIRDKFSVDLAKSAADPVRFNSAGAICPTRSRHRFCDANILHAAMQHHYTKVANCGFLRRISHEPIARGDDEPIKSCSLGRPRSTRGLKRKSSLNENRRPLARRSRTGAAPPRNRPR